MSLAHAVLAALWLVGLWVAAPLLQGGPRAADRLRDMLAIGTAITLGLGVTHLLYWPLCWIALIACIVAAYVRAQRPPKHRTHLHPEPHLAEPVPYLLLAALALIAWPSLVRPALDGGDLGAWAHAHTIWTANAKFWLNPPLSELFAGALTVAAASSAAGWSGVGAVALLGFRLFSWAREGGGLPVRLADALAAAVICILPIAVQAGSLQNDVWLAAFFVEILWSAPVDDATALRSSAMCALATPLGWLYAFIALGVSQARPRAWIAAGAAVAFWILRDAILWHGALVARTPTVIPQLLRTSALAHPLAAAQSAFAASARFAPFGLLLVLIALASPWLARELPLRFAGVAAVIAAMVAASSFEPATAAGALVLAPLTLRYGTLALILLLLALAGEALRVLLVYHDAAVAAVAILVAIVTPVAVAYARRHRVPATAIAGAAAVAIVITTLLAARAPAAHAAHLPHATVTKRHASLRPH
jgi:hypothetical protein